LHYEPAVEKSIYSTYFFTFFNFPKVCSPLKQTKIIFLFLNGVFHVGNPGNRYSGYLERKSRYLGIKTRMSETKKNGLGGGGRGQAKQTVCIGH